MGAVVLPVNAFPPVPYSRLAKSTSQIGADVTGYTTDPPKYLRLANQLRHAIQAGRYRDGDLLPSEPQLAREHGMSRPTVVRALELLRRDGLIESQQGRGTFVRTPLAASGDPGAEVERLREWLTEHHPQHMTADANPVDVAILLLGSGS